MAAGPVFDQIRAVYKGVESLQSALNSLHKGEDAQLSFASAPSVAQFIAARALKSVRTRYPDLYIDLNILKIEETLDYLLLERGEFVVMSSYVDNPGVENTELARGRIVAIVPESHPLAGRASVSVNDLAGEPLIGIDRRTIRVSNGSTVLSGWAQTAPLYSGPVRANGG